MDSFGSDLFQKKDMRHDPKLDQKEIFGKFVSEESKKSSGSDTEEENLEKLESLELVSMSSVTTKKTCEEEMINAGGVMDIQKLLKEAGINNVNKSDVQKIKSEGNIANAFASIMSIKSKHSGGD